MKRLVLSCVAVSFVPACSTPAGATPSELCDVLPAAEVSREFGEPAAVTKRLVSEPESPWAYCLYGTPTRHLLTLGAPVAEIAGNVRVLPGPGVDADLAAGFEKTANARIPGEYSIDPVDIPAACARLQPAAESVIGSVTHARGTADSSSLTCDFIGARGSVSAQSRPQAFVQSAELPGVVIAEEPDLAITGIQNARELTLTGYVDRDQVSITITPDNGYRTPTIGDAERKFAREFADASW